MGNRGKKFRNLALLFFSVLFLISLFSFSEGSILLGTAEGYVTYAHNGSYVKGADVTVYAKNTGTGTTDANGYYVIANLDAGAGELMTASAQKNLFTGSNSAITDAYQAAYINISLCQPPSSSVLTEQPNTRETSVTLSWTSGIDANGLAVYDQYVFDGVTTSPATSPQTETGLIIGSSYTWRVRTCNNWCCSPYSTDSFSLTNDAPTSPSIYDVPHTQNTTITFRWVPGIDPDGDSIYNQFQLAIDSSFTNITEQNLNILGNSITVSSLIIFKMYYWRVRTCDEFNYCSSWVSDFFFIYSCPECICPPASPGEGGITRIISSTILCIPDFQCGGWSDCMIGKQTRICVDNNKCLKYPEVIRACEGGLTHKDLVPAKTEIPFFENPLLVMRSEMGNMWVVNIIVYFIAIFSLGAAVFFYIKYYNLTNKK